MVITPHVIAGVAAAAITEFHFARAENNNERPLFLKSNRFKIILISCLLGFSSHFLLDAIPHYEYDIYASVPYDFSGIVIDSIVACTSLFIILHGLLRETARGLDIPSNLRGAWAKEKLRYVPFLISLTAAGFAAILPDIILTLGKPYFGVPMRVFDKFHHFWHTSIRISDGYAFMIEACITLGMAWFLLKTIPKIKIEIDSKQIAQELADISSR
ncbi:MAG TPA: hypothetical protein VJH71_02660 [Candidatus Paceibacterota bacterium]